MNEATREEARGTEEEQLAALTLSCMARPLLRHRVGTIREAGSCRAALERLEIPVSAHREAEETLERSLRRGFRLLCLTDSSYPPALSEAPDPPICLFIWGELLDDDELSISVVGSRRATPYGLSITRRIVAQLVEAGLTVTSGLARGIDGAAHRAAVEAGGRSLAVLGARTSGRSSSMMSSAPVTNLAPSFMRASVPALAGASTGPGTAKTSRF